ncbi:MAG: hypothetical protein KAQ90_07180 [Melioribacteraceae bacterium]|nr:hypothetical protein [Melioribacteraceae bacterium]
MKAFGCFFLVLFIVSAAYPQNINISSYGTGSMFSKDVFNGRSSFTNLTGVICKLYMKEINHSSLLIILLRGAYV